MPFDECCEIALKKKAIKERQAGFSMKNITLIYARHRRTDDGIDVTECKYTYERAALNAHTL